MWRVYLAKTMKILGTWGLLVLTGFVFDDILYPLMIALFGAVVGGGGMALIAILICVVMLYYYDKNGSDLLGVNVVEDVKKNGLDWVNKLNTKAENSFFWWFARIFLWIPSRVFLLVLWATKKNDMLAFIALNIFQDPFVATVFLRHGRFGGLTKRDWMIFFASAIFSNGYWIARNVVVVELLRLLWQQV